MRYIWEHGPVIILSSSLLKTKSKTLEIKLSRIQRIQNKRKRNVKINFVLSKRHFKISLFWTPFKHPLLYLKEYFIFEKLGNSATQTLKCCFE